jgi:hypothetical protein
MELVDHCMTCFQVLFVSEKTVIGVGFDCNPMVFAADERGVWCVNFQCCVSKFWIMPAQSMWLGQLVLNSISFQVEEK